MIDDLLVHIADYESLRDLETTCRFNTHSIYGSVFDIVLLRAFVTSLNKIMKL